MPSETYTADASIDRPITRNRDVIALIEHGADIRTIPYHGVIRIPHEGRCNDMDRRVK